MITVQDLLNEEELGLALLGGESGVTRQVSWAHSAEIPDISGFLSGGELILSTGLAFPEGKDQQLEYIDSLASAGAAALGLGTRRPDLTPEFLERADELGVPVLHAAWAVPYSKISRWVASRNSEAYQRNLELQLKILEVLRWQSDHGADPRAVIERLERLTDTRLSIAYEDGSPVIPGTPPMQIRLDAPNLLQKEPTRDLRRLKLPLASAQDVFLVVKANDPGFFSYGGALQQLSSALSILVANHFHEIEYSRRFQAELLSAFLSSGTIPPGSLRTLQSLGFSENDSSLAIAVVAAPDEAVRESLATHLQLDAAPALILTRQNELIVLTTALDTDWLQSGLARFGANAGISSAFAESSDLHVYLGQARWAAQYGHFEPNVHLVRFEDIEQFNPWLNLDPNAMNQVIEHILGSLLGYDEKHGTELVPTLSTFFQENRSLKSTAEKLLIHPQTLRYRLKRVQEITGRDLDVTQNLAELWWALSMLGASSSSRARAPRAR